MKRYKMEQSKPTGNWWVLKKIMNENSRFQWVIWSEHLTHQDAVPTKKHLDEL